MKSQTKKLFEVNSDISTIIQIIHEIGWKEIRESSIHRILYLSSVLYAFMDDHDENAFSNYHFSITPTGPYSDTIARSLVDLKSREIILDNEKGILKVDKESLDRIDYSLKEQRIEWFRTVIYILGLYGESKIFGFIIQDPQYKDDFRRNSQKEIDISDENKSIQTLNSFKNAFEETLDDVSEIDKKEYLDLYFEYVFSKIIKRSK
ncbi:MAG: hypothetical protein WD512_12560 [Candidatus Paceibacterota bacterium]